ncbi:MAG: EF-Tu/IF-2/RF-3 family GTPase, partial [Parcubacteria group bacterium]
ANPDLAQEQVYELFMDLGATDEQLDFETIYAIGREGIAKAHLDDESKNLEPLLDVILEKVQPAKADKSAELRMQPFNLGYDNFLGRLAVGRIHEGTIKMGEEYLLKKMDGTIEKSRITKLYTFKGVAKEEVQEAYAGDIAMVAGFPKIDIGETICENETQEALPAISIDEPTISLRFMVNDSPFAGREGKFVTNKQIRERLEKELEVNVGLKIDFSSAEFYTVFGRGELHVAILLENMRREGYEIQVSQPQVIIKDVDGVKSEPFEEVTIDVPSELSGTVIERLGKRKGIMNDMQMHGSQTRILFLAPTRGILGFRGQFVVDTKGEGIFSSRVIGFQPYAGEIKKREVGSMISMATGKVLGFSLANLQERGTLYVGPGMEVYEGMVIGNSSKGTDMSVNPTKGKQMSNMRSSGADEAIQLVPPMVLDIEKGLEVMTEDEYLEVTPVSVRLRKQFLTENDRIKAGRKAK